MVAQGAQRDESATAATNVPCAPPTINRFDPSGLTDYDEFETALFMEAARNDATGPLGLLTAFVNHFPKGQYDFKHHNELDTFVVGGHLYTASEFGNFLAGYSGVYAGQAVGYLGVRAGGVAVDFSDNVAEGERARRLGVEVPGRFDWDVDSIPEIDAGARRAVREILEKRRR